MSPRIAFWTSAFEPEIEAVASEVALLRRRFPASIAWGLNPNCGVRFSWRRGFCLNPRLHWLFRAATKILEPAFQLNHIFGSLGDWFYLHGVHCHGARCRPTVLTLATQAKSVAPDLLRHIDRFVVEYPAGRDILDRLGIDPSQVRLIFPPVDLARFTPSGPPSGPLTVLFASSPDEPSWLEARGVPQILEAATLRPEMGFRLLWRSRGHSLRRIQQWINERGLSNVELVVGRVADMAQAYAAAHATVALFSRMEQCKPAPNSLIESMACGRPVVTTAEVGLSELIHEARAGIVCASTSPALVEGLDRLRTDWQLYSTNARRCAERWFRLEDFLGRYQSLYQELL